MKKKELAERIATIEKHLGIDNQVAAFEVGKWYKSSEEKTLIYILEIHSYELIAYGFDKKGNFQEENNWFHDRVSIAEDTLSEATPEEVKSALVEEAKRRGHKPWDCLEGFWYDGSLNVLYDRFGIHKKVVFQNGKWAEIIEQPKSILDGKCAIQVNNDREFEILMKHYEEKEWNAFNGNTAHECYKIWKGREYPKVTSYENNFQRWGNIDRYTIIQFSEFAKEVGIEVPKEIEVKLYGNDNVIAIIGEEVTFKSNGKLLGVESLSHSDIEDISHAIQQLKGDDNA